MKIKPAEGQPPTNVANNRQRQPAAASLRPFRTGWIKPWQAYLFATAVTYLTLALRMMLDGQMEGRPILIIFTLPIMLSAYVGGLRPGLLATVISYLGATYYLLPPIHSFRVESTTDRLNIFFCVLAGVVISALNEALHRARHRTHMAERDQQARVAMVKAEALQNAIFNSANVSSIATDEKGVIQIFNAGAARMLGYSAAEVVNKFSPADISDPQEMISRAEALSIEFGTTIAPGLETLVFKASRGMEYIYEPTLIRKDGSRFPAVVAVAALRDSQGGIIGYLLTGTDNTALKRAEEERKRFFALSQDVFCILGFDGYFRDLNPAWERTLGYTKAELLGTPFIQFVHPDDRERTLAEAANVAGGKALIAFENRYLCKDGSYRWFRWSVTPIVEDQVMYGVAHDITEIKKTEQARQTGEARLHRLVDSNAQGVMFWNIQGGVTRANDAFLRIVGYTREDLEAGRICWTTMTPPEYADLDRQSLEQLATTGICIPFDKEFIRKDGSRVPITLGAATFDDNKNEGVCFVLDNSARKLAEEALLKAGALQRAIFESANFSCIATDAKGVIQLFNVGAERMLGYTAAEVTNKITPADLHDPAEVIARATALSLELSTTITPGFQALAYKASRGIEDVYELTKIRKDGSRFPAVVSVTALRDAQEGIIGYLLIGTDNTARKLAEEALLKAGALQRAIFESANFSSIATDARGVIQIFNVGAERMLGYTAAEVMNKITPADISDPQEVIARATALSVELGTNIAPGFDALVFKASRGIEDIYELTYIRKDGSRFPAVVSVTALRDAQDGIIGYLLIGTDNTARRLAEGALRKAGAFQNAIFNSANFSCIATDAKGVIQLFNVGAERLLGYKAAEVMNKLTPADLHDPRELITRATALSLETGATVAPGFEAVVYKAAQGVADIYELTKIRKDGSRFPAVVSVTALRDAQEGIIGYMLIGSDNTARQQAASLLKESERRLTLATTAAGVGIWDWDVKANKLSWDAKMFELYCLPEMDFSATYSAWQESLHPEDRERAEAELSAAVERGSDFNLEFRIIWPDGKIRVLEAYGMVQHAEDGSPARVIGVNRDITERKSFEESLKQTNLELECAKFGAEKANLAKSDFLSSMSHELRTPLNAILGFAQLMESASPPPTVSQTRSIAQILHAGWYLLKLINEILDLAVIESGKLSLSKESVSLSELMDECQAMIDPQAQKSGIGMTFPRFENLLHVSADRTRLKQIVINLLSNAIKYNQERGSVTVECTVSAPGRIRISVRDTGVGLSSEKLAQLFQPFNRLGQEDGGVAGTGIGLVVSKQLTELMGGTLGVESAVGVGSVFWCELEAAEAPQLEGSNGEDASGLQSELPAEAPRRTLLYVEDNPANMQLVEELISRFPDMGLVTAVNGTLGIQIARTTQPKVILMDINLPGISGFKALRILQEDPVTAHIPVIALSANAMQRDMAKGLEAGFFRYLTKPIKIKEFMETLNAALEFAEEPVVQNG